MLTAVKRLASWTAVGLGISLTPLALGTVAERPVTGAVALAPLSMTVVSTAANPVPTSAIGTTQIAGAVSVSGTPTVNIGSGTVSVTSSPASPISVQEVAPRDPIGAIPINRLFWNGNSGIIYAVSAGKVLIVEQVHGAIFNSQDVTPSSLIGRVELGLGAVVAHSTPSEDGSSYISQQVRAYFYAGDVHVYRTALAITG